MRRRRLFRLLAIRKERRRSIRVCRAAAAPYNSSERSEASEDEKSGRGSTAQRRRCHMDADARTSASTAAAAFSALVADSRDGSAAENDTALVSSASTDR